MYSILGFLLLRIYKDMYNNRGFELRCVHQNRHPHKVVENDDGVDVISSIMFNQYEKFVSDYMKVYFMTQIMEEM